MGKFNKDTTMPFKPSANERRLFKDKNCTCEHKNWSKNNVKAPDSEPPPLFSRNFFPWNATNVYDES